MINKVFTMVNNVELFEQIVALDDFNNHDINMRYFFIWAFIGLMMLLGYIFNWINDRKTKDSRKKEIFKYCGYGWILIWFVIFIVFFAQVTRSTPLNDKQIAFLQTIDDPSLIKAINYQVAQYGTTFYAIRKGFLDTEMTLKEIERKRKDINPPEFLKLETN